MVLVAYVPAAPLQLLLMATKLTPPVGCRCPYYRTAERGLYGTLSNANGDSGYGDSYWGNLDSTTLTNSQCGINLPGFPDKLKAAFMTDTSNPTCGEWLQFTSQYPGKGPCYPVLVQTVDHLNRFASLSWHVCHTCSRVQSPKFCTSQLARKHSLQP